jgi:hypothetical protein
LSSLRWLPSFPTTRSWSPTPRRTPTPSALTRFASNRHAHGRPEPSARHGCSVQGLRFAWFKHYCGPLCSASTQQLIWFCP